ncbi:hypothetical protein [Streptomyces sp. ITFR-16]|uniref:hypothetical protein n=1 Tax=Streptomyces sp. ITFR-16 TaxID=3075198 RepID=UPI0037DA60B6
MGPAGFFAGAVVAHVRVRVLHDIAFPGVFLLLAVAATGLFAGRMWPTRGGDRPSDGPHLGAVSPRVSSTWRSPWAVFSTTSRSTSASSCA